MTTNDPIRRGERVTGERRDELAKKWTLLYQGGLSIRDITKLSGRSYGAVHRMLSEAGVVLRGRGGAVGKDGGLSEDQRDMYRTRLADLYKKD